MIELEKPTFDAAAFLASAGLGRRIIHLAPKDAFFRREIQRTRFFIFRRVVQKSQSFPQPGRKLLSRWFPQVNLWERER